MFLSIKTTILAALVGLQLIAAGIIISSSYITSETAVLRQGERLMIETAKNTIRHTQSFLLNAELAVNLAQGLQQSRVLDETDQSNLERFFFEKIKVSPEISGLYYGNHQGLFVFVNRSNDIEGAEYRTKKILSPKAGANLTYRNNAFLKLETAFDATDLYDPRTRPWYKKALEMGSTTWTDPYIFYTSQTPGITVAAPVFDAEGQVDGVIGIDMEIAAISSFLANLKIGESGTAFILAKNGDVIAHPDPTKIKKLKGNGETGLRFAKIEELGDPVTSAVVNKISKQDGDVDFSVDQFARVNVGDQVYDAVFAPFNIGNLEWTIAIYVPENEFLGSIVEGRAQNIAIAITIGCITILLGWFIARLITSPLTSLSQCADQIARGEIADTSNLPENFLELKHVSTAFRRMTRWLADYKTKNSDMNEELATSAKILEGRVEDLRTEIADRKRAEAQSQQLQNELTHVARFSTTGEMAASLAHELNQPLTAITQYCDALLNAEKSDTPTDKEVTESIEEMQDQAFRAGEIIRQLRQFIRKGETDAELVNLSELIDQTIRLIDPQARENNIEIIVDVEEEAPKIMINRVQIAQVLVNLLRNSVEAIVTSGSKERIITVTTRLHGTATEIIVEDTGPGLKSVTQAFKPFETSKSEGMGMGLSISRSIIEAHNGQLVADRNVDEGARFRITLPNQLRKAS